MFEHVSMHAHVHTCTLTWYKVDSTSDSEWQTIVARSTRSRVRDTRCNVSWHHPCPRARSSNAPTISSSLVVIDVDDVDCCCQHLAPASVVHVSSCCVLSHSEHCCCRVMCVRVCTIACMYVRCANSAMLSTSMMTPVDIVVDAFTRSSSTMIVVVRFDR